MTNEMKEMLDAYGIIITGDTSQVEDEEIIKAIGDAFKSLSTQPQSPPPLRHSLTAEELEKAFELADEFYYEKRYTDQLSDIKMCLLKGENDGLHKEY